MKLSELKEKQKAKILSVGGDEAFKSRLNNIWLKVDGEVKVLRFSPFNDPIEIEVNNNITVAIRKVSAENIEVKIIE